MSLHEESGGHKYVPEVPIAPTRAELEAADREAKSGERRFVGKGISKAAQCAAAYSANLKKLTALLDDVTVRAMVAVCKREDGSEVWQEAKAISKEAHAEA